MHRVILAVCASLLLASTASAQIIGGRRGPRGGAFGAGLETPWSVSAALGFLIASEVSDGSTGSVWDFGSTLQYRLSADRRIGDGSAIGITAGYASMPMVYFRTGSQPPITSVCPLSCNASADLWSIAALFHAGGSQGFHQILEIGVGMNIYSNFRDDDTGTELHASRADRDFMLSLGYGFGYGISQRFHVMIIQDAGLTVHQRTGLAGNESAINQILVTRVGVRVGIGS